MAVIICVSSAVARGHVGNSATVFALQRLGHEVWPANTVLLPFHPGHGRASVIVTPPADMAALFEALAATEHLAEVSGVLSGYMASADQARVVAGMVRRLKIANPRALYCCDPILGDGHTPGSGALYVPEPVALAISDELVPLADIVTPNLFELAWLTGRAPKDAAAVMEACASLGAAVTLVTSAPAFYSGSIATLLVTGKGGLSAETRKLDRVPHGTGDLLAALFFGHVLKGADHEQALMLASGSLFDLLMHTVRLERDELALTQAQDALVAPRSQPRLNRLPAR